MQRCIGAKARLGWFETSTRARSRDLSGGVLMSRRCDSRSTRAKLSVANGTVDATPRFGVVGALVDRAAFTLPFWVVTAAPAVTIACRIWLR